MDIAPLTDNVRQHAIGGKTTAHMVVTRFRRSVHRLLLPDGY
jgi:hypothetical protein